MDQDTREYLYGTDEEEGGWAIVRKKNGEQLAGFVDAISFAGVGFLRLSLPIDNMGLQRGRLLSPVLIGELEWCSEATARAFAPRLRKRSSAVEATL